MAIIKNPTTIIMKQQSQQIILGVSGLADSSKTLTRTDSAVGLTWLLTNNEIISDFDDYFPYNQMQKTTIGFYNSSGSGSDEVPYSMVYVPGIWWRIGFNSSGELINIAISESKITPGQGQVSYYSKPFFYGCYKGTFYNSYLSSTSGYAHMTTSYTGANWSSSGLNSKISTRSQCVDLYHLRIMQMLWLIEFGTKSSKDVMYGSNSRLSSAGTTDTMTAASGQLSGTGSRMRWRYIEDFVGNQAEFIDGLYSTYNSSGTPTLYVRDNISQSVTSGTVWTFTNSGTTMGSNVIKSLYAPKSTNPLLLVPKEVINTGYTTYFCNDCSISNSTAYFLSYNAGSNAKYGLFYFSNSYGTDSKYSWGRLMCELC